MVKDYVAFIVDVCDRIVNLYFKIIFSILYIIMAKQMLKRKDGSVSQKGLWDNIRANKGSGKAPTKEMLKQEKKIKTKKKK